MNHLFQVQPGTPGALNPGLYALRMKFHRLRTMLESSLREIDGDLRLYLTERDSVTGEPGLVSIAGAHGAADACLLTDQIRAFYAHLTGEPAPSFGLPLAHVFEEAMAVSSPPSIRETPITPNAHGQAPGLDPAPAHPQPPAESQAPPAAPGGGDLIPFDSPATVAPTPDAPATADAPSPAVAQPVSPKGKASKK